MKKYNITQSEINIKVSLHPSQSSNRFILQDMILTDIDLSNKSVPSGSCVRCVLENVNFTNGNFPSNNFQSSDLTNVDFSGANLLCANFRYTNLKNVNFTGANLKGADFTGCEIENVIFENCDVSDKTILPQIRSEPINLLNCTIKKAANLTKKLVKVLILVASIGVVIGLFAYGLSRIWDMLVECITNYVKSVMNLWFLVVSSVSKFISDIISVLTSVPWFVWVGISVPMAILVYSYVWCYRKNYPVKFERKIYSIKDVLTSNVPLIVMVVGLYLLGILWCETLRAFP